MGAVAWPTLGDAKQKAAAPSMRSSDDAAKTAPSEGGAALRSPAASGSGRQQLPAKARMATGSGLQAPPHGD
eukprot:SM005319S18167  [mRNA]  locus=s5319:263:619:- [translate_table: standard]